jgi:type IX secretion system PorP/SprF family membrane protein
METNNATLLYFTAKAAQCLSIICLIYLVIAPHQSFAQQEPNYSQFMYNKLPINPAYAGVRDLWSMRMVYRDQWTQLKGHPRTMSVSANGPLKKDNIGLGVSLVHDEIGLTRNTWLTSSYAYRIRLNPGGKQNMSFSMGMHAGVLLYKANLHEVNPVEDNDPTFSQAISRVLPDVGAGWYFTGKNFYVSASVPNFIPSDLHNKEDINSLPDNFSTKRVPHFFVMAGGIIQLDAEGNIKLRPQVMTKNILSKVHKAPVDMDINLSIMLYEWVNFGVSYRTALGNKKVMSSEQLTDPESIVGMLEFWPTKRMLVGYSFDYTLGELRQYNKGTHEIVLGYDLEPKRKKGKAIGCYHF